MVQREAVVQAQESLRVMEDFAHGTFEPHEKGVERCNTEEPEARKVERTDTAMAVAAEALAGLMKLAEALEEISHSLELQLIEVVVEG